MIKSIDIVNFGSFKNFVWHSSLRDKGNNVAEFKRLNICMVVIIPEKLPFLEFFEASKNINFLLIMKLQALLLIRILKRLIKHKLSPIP